MILLTYFKFNYFLFFRTTNYNNEQNSHDNITLYLNIILSDSFIQCTCNKRLVQNVILQKQ